MTGKERSGTNFAVQVQKLAGSDGPELVSPLVASEDLTLEVILSTDSPDRDGDRVALEGWDVENFLRNPVVLWAHDTKLPPVAKVLELFQQDGSLKARLQFTPKAVNPFGYMTYRLYAEGFLKGLSVGFLPKQWQPVSDEDQARRAAEGQPAGIHYLRQELLEVSCVPLPANPKALVTARRQGIDVEPLLRWTKSALSQGQQNFVSTPQLKALTRSLYPKMEPETGHSTALLLPDLSSEPNLSPENVVPEPEVQLQNLEVRLARLEQLVRGLTEAISASAPIQAIPSSPAVSDGEKALATIIGRSVARRINQISGNL